MNEAEISREAFDADLFSPEELELMRDATGVIGRLDAEPDVVELQRQYVALAKLVAEGGERERQLRALVNDLAVLARAHEQQRSHHEQTQSLAKLVLASSERELQLQECLKTLRGVMLTRARTVA